MRCRGVYPPAEDYITHADKSHMTLVEAFRNMQIEEEEPLENGDFDHEVYSAYGPCVSLYALLNSWFELLKIYLVTGSHDVHLCFLFLYFPSK